jgi:uncharacterized protein (TIGR03067 family)
MMMQLITAAALQGAWRILQITAAGAETPSEDVDDRFIWFTSNIIVYGNQEAAWDMPCTIQYDRLPAQIDIVREDRREPWLELGILDLTDDMLRICTSGSAIGTRPTDFASSAANGWTLYVAQRSDEPLPE